MARGKALDADLAALGAARSTALYDVRAGRWSTLVSSTPLIPGRGNHLRWSDLGASDPGGPRALAEPTWAAFWRLLERWQPQLRIDLHEITTRPRVSVAAQGALIHIYAPRMVGGVPVRDAALTATVSHGNLVLLGLNQWGDVAAPAAPAIPAAGARQVVTEHLRAFVVESFGAEPHLELIPLARGADAGTVVAGNGYDYRLAWVVTAKVRGDVGAWEALVDATSGLLLSLEDTNQYQTARTVVGGVYPTSNDGALPDGVEQPGYPMPYTDVHTGGDTFFTTSGGGAGCADGTIRTTLSGRYVDIVDVCGAIDEASTGSLDLGTSAGSDCTVPAGHSAGDTHAARTTYYELNRIMEQARGYLPDNEWLQAPLTANVNINQACNAFWNGSTVNFFRRSLPSGCGNTGELASVVDHEFAHGLDNNAGDTRISRPSEAMGHVLAALRQQDSCVGRGFDLFSTCSGFGDACTSCNGIEDVDFARHLSGAPHDLADAMVCPFAGGSTGPCGRVAFCEAMIVGEAAWDLFARDLRNPATFNYDGHTALELATRLFYLGGQNVFNWYTCTSGVAGCNADGGYLNLLAADDDDGDLSNGTPHMSAIFAAFNRHGIACATPAPAVPDSGCPGGPTAAPALSATPLDQGATLSWTPVAGATRYAVFRTEGVKGCDSGKAKVGETAGNSFRDEGLLNGFAYHYTVLPVGAVDSCSGRMSACQTVTPAPGSNLAFAGHDPVQTVTGDGDAFLDNCEAATVRVTLENTGATTLTNVRIVGVAPVGNPSDFLTTFPVLAASSLSSCHAATASFAFVPQGLSFDATGELLVTFTADELPEARTARVLFAHAESDFAQRATHTWSFETDLEGWQVAEGTWTRSSAGGGANGTSFYVRSSQGLDNQCDRIQSPLVRLDAGSTLSLSARYQTEPPSFGEHYDVASIGLATDAGTRSTISPDAGNLYNVPSVVLFNCLQNGPGWEGTNPGNPAFSASSWSPAALNPGGTFTGVPVRLDVAYGTDIISSLDGFRFDEVTLTNFAEQVVDGQDNSCSAPLYFDGFDDGSMPPWTFTGPWRQQNGFLSSRRRTASALATDFPGCVECSLTTALRTRRGGRRPSDGRVFIWFHWQDAQNHVALELAPGQAILRRVQDGLVADSSAADFTLVRNRRYLVKIAYTEKGYAVTIEGTDVLALDPLPSPKGGTFGLGSDGAVTSFDFVAVE
jgi:hypothetical protein